MEAMQGGDMPSMSGTMSGTMTMDQSMVFHVNLGDTLWFHPFVVSTASSVFGACVLLFFVGILSRFLDALSRIMTMRWAAEQRQIQQQQRSGHSIVLTSSFIASHDLPRGLLFLVHSFFLYLLMLAAMTFNAYFFIALLLGLGVGETLFGRFGRPCSPWSPAGGMPDSASPGQTLLNGASASPCCRPGLTRRSLTDSIEEKA